MISNHDSSFSRQHLVQREYEEVMNVNDNLIKRILKLEVENKALKTTSEGQVNAMEKYAKTIVYLENKIKKLVPSFSMRDII